MCGFLCAYGDAGVLAPVSLELHGMNRFSTTAGLSPREEGHCQDSHLEPIRSHYRGPKLPRPSTALHGIEFPRTRGIATRAPKNQLVKRALRSLTFASSSRQGIQPSGQRPREDLLRTTTSASGRNR